MPEEAADSSRVKVKKSQVEKAIRALSQLNAKRSANTNQLFDANAETMSVLFTLSRVPEKRTMRPMLIELPHPMFNDKSEVCFLSKDPQKQFKELLLQKHPVPGLTKVIGLEKLKKNYKTAESKRALADAFDLFLCDSSIVEMMPKVLGIIFYEKKKKRPIPVRMRGEDPTPNLKKAIGGTTLRVPSGPCIGVKFGRCSMDEKHLIENASAVITFVSKYLASNPVQSISLQATDSPALPVWRRTQTGEPLDLKKHASETVSSSASDTGTGGASETEDATSVHGSELPSDAGETFSANASEIDTAGETSMSELETQSELDSEAGDEVHANILPEHVPLLKSLKMKGKKKKRLEAEVVKAPEEEPMPPPKKKSKKKAS
jgi:ribosome biogenesis protein UTP30